MYRKIQNKRKMIYFRSVKKIYSEFSKKAGAKSYPVHTYLWFYPFFPKHTPLYWGY